MKYNLYLVTVPPPTDINNPEFSYLQHRGILLLNSVGLSGDAVRWHHSLADNHGYVIDCDEQTLVMLSLHGVKVDRNITLERQRSGLLKLSQEEVEALRLTDMCNSIGIKNDPQ